MQLHIQVIRVLNLWQKNGVFTTEDIQPLFDMANAQSEIYKSLDLQMKNTGKIVVGVTSLNIGPCSLDKARYRATFDQM